jgi:hypothetical protein
MRINITITQKIERIICNQLLIIKSEIFTTAFVRAGRATQVCKNAPVILGTINTIIKTTIITVKVTKIEGYTIAHFTLHLISIFSSKLLSNSVNILPSCHVFSQTQIRAVVNWSNTFEYLSIVSCTFIPWSIFSFISITIFFKYGFLVCFVKSTNAAFISIQEFI